MNILKRTLKEILLSVGLYYKINGYRFRHNQRDVSQREFYSNWIGEGDLVFDVGANIGQRADIFSQLADTVVAFEPQTQCVRHLKSRFMFSRKVRIEQAALSDREGEAVIYESDSHTLSSMSRDFIDTVSKEKFKEYKWETKVVVKTKTLDQMIKLYGLPKFIKIDVEGFELNVLNGLNHAVPFISFEFTPELIEEAKKCVRRINDISDRYSYNYCLGEDLNFRLKEHAGYLDFLHNVLPEIGSQGYFGDVYAILR